ncbi:MAG: PilZ domain-containing protein [Desulfobacterales bacterium]|jgi:hypothetical protein
MEYDLENRKGDHLTYLGSALIKDMTSGTHCYAKLNNMSCNGMYFEAECAFNPGDIIDIQFETPPFKGSPKSYSAKVYWCMLLSKDKSRGQYGIGVKFI